MDYKVISSPDQARANHSSLSHNWDSAIGLFFLGRMSTSFTSYEIIMTGLMGDNAKSENKNIKTHD